MNEGGQVPSLLVRGQHRHSLIQLVNIWSQNVRFDEVSVTVNNVGQQEQNKVMKMGMADIKVTFLHEDLMVRTDNS